MLRAFVNGRKLVAEIVDLNIAEGWVEIEDLTVIATAYTEDIEDPDQVLAELPADPEPIKLPTKKLYGVVTIKAEFDELE
jgi:hypothetical protein